METRTRTFLCGDLFTQPGAELPAATHGVGHPWTKRSVSHSAGDIWAGKAQVAMGFFIDARADEHQRQALQRVFSGQAGGFMAGFAQLINEVRGIEFVPISFEVADDLAYWRAEIAGKVTAAAEALTGPMTPPGKRVRTLNPPGSEVGPGQVATWGKTTTNLVDVYGFHWDWAGKSSKHIPFEWKGPEQGNRLCCIKQR